MHEVGTKAGRSTCVTDGVCTACVLLTESYNKAEVLARASPDKRLKSQGWPGGSNVGVVTAAICLQNILYYS